MNDSSPQLVPRREQLLALLVDGQLHSGEKLAEQLQVTRAAIWKLVKSLRDLGITIESQHHGYQLPHAVDLYDAHKLIQLCDEQGTRLQQVNCLFTVDSTNQYVQQHPVRASGQAVLCVAELQQAGRGRRGRHWVAPFGESVCMSLGWLFESLPPDLSSLSLVVGTVLIRVLRRFGAHEVGVKWPNDLWWRGCKLAGVLIEMRGEPDGQAQVVIGVGVNLRLSLSSRQQLHTQQIKVCDVYEMLAQQAPTRNQLVAAFTKELLICLPAFAANGFAPFIAEWQSYDVLAGAEVQVLQGDQCVLGVAKGIALDGALLVDTAEGVQRFISGEVSLRPRFS